MHFEGWTLAIVIGFVWWRVDVHRAQQRALRDRAAENARQRRERLGRLADLEPDEDLTRGPRR